jgi:hypothetical protein
LKAEGKRKITTEDTEGTEKERKKERVASLKLRVEEKKGAMWG